MSDTTLNRRAVMGHLAVFLLTNYHGLYIMNPNKSYINILNN
jgi:hypothetical protein